jgi:putative membrane protein
LEARVVGLSGISLKSISKEDTMNTKNSLITAAAFMLLLVLAPALATGAAVGSQDEKFVKDAAVGGMMEVELGRLAVQKAANGDVKKFGQRMTDDHGKTNAQLKQLASQKSISLPTTLPADKRQEVQNLSKLSGAEFDKMYMSHMVKDHKKNVSEFEKQSSNGGDASLKSFAQQTLPTLREHLQLAQNLASKVGAPPDHGHGRKSGS